MTLIKKQAVVLSIYSLVMIALITFTVIIWQQLLTMLAVALYLFGFIFIGENKLMPLIRYRRFLCDIRDGLFRETEGNWLAYDSDIVMRDGVAVHAVSLDEGHDVPRLLYWDDDKPAPDIMEGARVHIITHGSFIKNLELIS